MGQVNEVLLELKASGRVQIVECIGVGIWSVSPACHPDDAQC